MLKKKSEIRTYLCTQTHICFTDLYIYLYITLGAAKSSNPMELRWSQLHAPKSTYVSDRHTREHMYAMHT